MRENVIRSVELGVALAACYMAAVTMVQTTLYDKVINMIKDSFMGPLLEPYMPYINLAVMVLALALCFILWRKLSMTFFSSPVRRSPSSDLRKRISSGLSAIFRSMERYRLLRNALYI